MSSSQVGACEWAAHRKGGGRVNDGQSGEEAPTMGSPCLLSCPSAVLSLQVALSTPSQRRTLAPQLHISSLKNQISSCCLRLEEDVVDACRGVVQQ